MEKLLPITDANIVREKRGVDSLVWALSQDEPRVIEYIPDMSGIFDIAAIKVSGLEPNPEMSFEECERGVKDYIESVFDEQIKMGNGAVIKFAKIIGQNFNHPTYFYYGVARTIEVLDKRVTSEPISIRDLRDAYANEKMHFQKNNPQEPILSRNYMKLDKSLRDWEMEIGEEMDENGVGEEFLLGFNFATMGYAIREERRQMNRLSAVDK